MSHLYHWHCCVQTCCFVRKLPSSRLKLAYYQATRSWLLPASRQQVRHSFVKDVRACSQHHDQKPFSITMDVRDSELDQFGVVNNSYYMVYTQHVRHEWLASLGVDMEALAQSGRAFALSEMNLKFWHPLRSRQRFRGTAKVARMGAARLVVEQQLLLLPDGTTGSSSETVVLDAVCTIVNLNEQYKPIAFSPELRCQVQP